MRSPNRSGHTSETGTGRAPIEVDAERLAETLRSLLPTALVGFDVDGVLAPIVRYADDARLTAGVSEHLARLGECTSVVILSGRALDDLERLFAFPAGLHVIGSHGLEERGAGDLTLDDDERRALRRLTELGDEAVEAAGDGAWLEHKPASVVVHTRAADPDRAAAAIDRAVAEARLVAGAQIKPGHHVLELLARSASKGAALLALGARLDRSPLIFVGDDVTDEDAFALMGDGDVSVRVGPGASAARFRLAGPDAVAELLVHLVS